MEEWEKIISVANIFSDSTKLLKVFQTALSKQNNSDAVNISKQTIIPTVGLKAFACEMYLKSYLSKGGATSIPKTHN